MVNSYKDKKGSSHCKEQSIPEWLSRFIFLYSMSLEIWAIILVKFSSGWSLYLFIIFCQLSFRPSVYQGYLIGWLTCVGIVISSFNVASDGGIGYISPLLFAVFRRRYGVIRVVVLELLNSRTFEFTFCAGKKVDGRRKFWLNDCLLMKV